VWNGHALVDASAAMSWRAYKEAKARFELPALAHDRLTVGAQARWQDYTQVNYFGRGPDALHEQRSEYRLQDTDVLGYGIVHPHAGLSVSGRFGWLKQPALSSPTGPFDRDYPNALEQFAGEPGVTDPTSYLHGDVAVTADSRNHPGHPTRGGFYRAAAGFYSDRNLDRYSIRRYEAEGLQMLPVATEKWLLALHGWGVFSDTAALNDVPFYLLPSLGGDRTLRGYDNFRFHDRNLLLASVESRWALFRQVDAALFAEAGNVAARAGDLNFDKTSYGAGVRVHTRTATIGRLDVGHGREGWQVFVALNDPLRLTRRTERNTVVPFVP
jgi:outer membrane protein assembly factor BamA